VQFYRIMLFDEPSAPPALGTAAAKLDDWYTLQQKTQEKYLLETIIRELLEKN